MLKKFLMKQIQTRRLKDWISQVLKDIKELDLEITIETLTKIKKSQLKTILNQRIEEKSFRDLIKKKESHSKVNRIKHIRLKMQNYLKPNGFKVRIEEAQEIFKMRS